MPLPLQISLAHARIAGETVAAESSPVPGSAAEAYAVQDQLINLIDSPVVGWKIGATSTAMQERLGLRAPISGPIFANSLFESGTTLERDSYPHDLGAECEIVLRTKTAVLPGSDPFDVKRARALVDAVIPAIELVCSRFDANLDIPPALIVADGSLHAALVTGVPLDPPTHDLTTATCTSMIDGEVTASGTGVDVLGGPYIALAWLINHLISRGHELPAGSLVSTGTCTGIAPLAREQHAINDAGSLGRADVRLS
ncbi:MAG: 2-keto-4-pentenoate hydratase [Candidatus Poriferisodalaceae bacterium]